MTPTLDGFSKLVGQIYDASLDASAWPAALEDACSFVGAPMGALGLYSVSEKRYDLRIFAGYEARWIDLYREKYGALNPLAGSTNGQRVGEIKCLSAAGLIGAFEGDPMYEEWVKPQRILDVAEVVLDASSRHAATLAFATRIEDGEFTPDNLRRIDLIFPHVRRSVLVSRILNTHRREEGVLGAVVDGLSAAVFVLGAHRQVLRSNRAGQALLSARVLVDVVGGGLQLRPLEADQAFRTAFNAAATGLEALGENDATIALPTVDGRLFVAHLLPLSSAVATGDLEAPGGVVAVFIRETHPDLKWALGALARAYRLTAAEARVAGALAEVGSTPMVAQALGVTVATVRTHLRSLYEKTGARRQAEIVSLLTGFASPFG